MIAPACSAAFPTIGSKIMLRKLTDKPQEVDASCKNKSYFSTKLTKNNIINSALQYL